jgi:hypothetical protein
LSTKEVFRDRSGAFGASLGTGSQTGIFEQR